MTTQSSKMRVTQRIPTSQYAYIEYEGEYATIEDAMDDHKRALSLYSSAKALSVNEWAKVRDNMLRTGECDPNLSEEMSAAQRWFINELKKGLRACRADDPVVE